jgi:hypothetical protein
MFNCLFGDLHPEDHRIFFAPDQFRRDDLADDLSLTNPSPQRRGIQYCQSEGQAQGRDSGSFVRKHELILRSKATRFFRDVTKSGHPAVEPTGPDPHNTLAIPQELKMLHRAAKSATEASPISTGASVREHEDTPGAAFQSGFSTSPSAGDTLRGSRAPGTGFCPP